MFNVLTAAGAEVSNYPFCTIEPNRATVPVPDSRLEELERMVKPEKTIPAAINFIDIAGLVKGAHKGEGLGNKFLAHIREVDAIVHLVRCFKDEDVSHVSGTVDPVSDIEIVELELTFTDMETIGNRLNKLNRQAKRGGRDILKEIKLLKKIKTDLEAGNSVRNLDFSGEEKNILDQLFLLTDKPVLYAANVSEKDIGKEIGSLELASKVRDYAEKEGSSMLFFSARIEEELLQLEEKERFEFMEELGLSQIGVDRLVNACYELLDLISFFTIKLPEVRAWTVEKGIAAQQAAGKIHTDFEKGFICAEVISYPKLMGSGSFQTAKEKGLVRQEGKDYPVKDGDVMLFKFNV